MTKILCDGLTMMGVEIKIVTSRIDEVWFSKYVNRVEFLRAKPDFDAVVNEIAEIARKVEPDAVVAMVQEPFLCYAAKKGAGTKVPCIMYVHFPLDEEIESENLEEYHRHYRFPEIASKYLSYVDAVVVNSIRTRIATKFVWGVDAEVVYPCIDDVFVHPEPEKKVREPAILYVGRFVALKRQDFLLLAFKELKKHVPNARLVLAGFVDPRHREYYEHVKELVDNARDELKDVELVANPSDEELVELYKEAKVYAHPRIGEHFGMAPIEAMSLGGIVVIRAPTGLSEVVENGVEAYVTRSDQQFVQTIKKVLRMDYDEWVKYFDRRTTLAKKFNAKKFGTEMIEVIKKVIQKLKS